MKKYCGLWLGLMLGLCLFSIQTGQAGDILVPNGDFELANDEGQPIDWFVDLVNPEKNKVAVDTKVYHSGKSSLYFEKGCSPKDYEGTTTPGLGSWMYMRSKEFTLPKPGKYLFSYWVKQGDGPGELWFVLYRTEPLGQLNDDKGTPIVVCKDKSGDWKLYEKVIEIPRDWTTLGIQPQMLNANKAWIDEIKITPLDEEEE